MVGNEFVVVFAWLFETEEKNDELLTPVSRMHEVVSFQVRDHIPVRIAYGGGMSEGGMRVGRDGRDLAKSALSDTSKLAVGT